MPKKTRKKARASQFSSKNKVEKIRSFKTRKSLTQNAEYPAEDCDSSYDAQNETDPVLSEDCDSSYDAQNKTDPVLSEDCDSSYDAQNETDPVLSEVLEPLIEESIAEGDVTHGADESEASSMEEKVASAGLIPIANPSEVSGDIQIVSNVIVIETMANKTTTEKPWFSLKDRIFEEAVNPTSPSSVVVIHGPCPSPLEGKSPLQDDKSFDGSTKMGGGSSRMESSPLPEEAGPPVAEIGRDSPPKDTPKLDVSDTALFLRVRELLLLVLPPQWTPIAIRDGIYVGLLADSKIGLFQRSLFFSSDGSIVASANGREIPPDHSFWQGLQKKTLHSETVKEFAQFVRNSVQRFRMLDLCKGVEEYKEVWKTATNATIDQNIFQEKRFKTTCRSNQCSMLVTQFKGLRCGQCAQLRRILSKRSKSRKKLRSTAASTSASPATPKTKTRFGYLTTPEKRKRLTQKTKEIKKLRTENARMKQKIEELIAREGIDINSSTTDEFTDILTAERNKSNSKLTDFQKFFIEQQLKASSVKSPSGMRWHPAMIRLALSLSMNSPSAYEELSAVIKLPSRRQIFNYSHALESKEGCHDGILKQYQENLEERRKGYSYEQYHVVKFDEVHIKKNLVLKKHTGELVGYVKLNELDKELDLLKSTVSQLADASVGGGAASPPEDPPLVSKMLSYMVTNATDGEQAVVACFGVSNLSAEKLYAHTWDVVGTLERCGIAVIALVCDGATTNTAFFQMHNPLTKTDSGVVFDSVNLYAPDRPIFFLTDTPHLLKTLRNCLYQSGKKSKKRRGQYLRNMRKKGQSLVWSSVEKFYQETKGDTLRKGYKLNEENVYLTSYSVMRVSLAAHVLSRSFAAELRLREWSDCTELANYCDTINDIFDMLNGKGPFQDIRTRNELLAPYKSPDEWRFEELLQKWKYFEDWESDIKALPQTKRKGEKADRAKMIVSKQSLQGLERTIKGFIGSVQYALKVADAEGQEPEILARYYQQDDLEHYFSKQRAVLGGNRHPDFDQALQSNININQQRQLGLRGPKKGNTSVNKGPSVADLSAPLAMRKTVRRAILPVSSE